MKSIKKRHIQHWLIRVGLSESDVDSLFAPRLFSTYLSLSLVDIPQLQKTLSLLRSFVRGDFLTTHPVAAINVIVILR